MSARATLWLSIMAASACAPRAPVREVPALSESHREPDLISTTHVVAEGETLYRIARGYHVAVDDLMAVNGLTDPRALAVGQRLLIPGVAAPAELSTGADAGVAEAEAPAPVPAGPSAAQARPGEGKGDLQWPLRGVLYARFGKKGVEPHDGIDLAAPAGTPVKTAAPGTVIFAGERPGYGQIVIVEHGSGLITLYAHNRDLRVKEGQRVRAEQVIATVGESGRTSGPHLHFEVRRGGLPVDPLLHLGAIPQAPEHGAP